MTMGITMSYDKDIQTNINKVTINPEELKNIYYQNHKICWTAINLNVDTFKYVRANMLDQNNYFSLCEFAIRTKPEYIKIVNLNFISSANYCKIAEIALRQNGMLINELNYNKIKSISNKDETYQQLHFKNVAFQRLYLIAVQQNGMALKFYKKYKKEHMDEINYNIYFKAVSQNGLALQYITEQNIQLEEICLIAIRQNIDAYKYVSFYSDRIEFEYKKLLSNLSETKEETKYF